MSDESCSDCLMLPGVSAGPKSLYFSIESGGSEKRCENSVRSFDPGPVMCCQLPTKKEEYSYVRGKRVSRLLQPQAPSTRKFCCEKTQNILKERQWIDEKKRRQIISLNSAPETFALTVSILAGRRFIRPFPHPPYKFCSTSTLLLRRRNSETSRPSALELRLKGIERLESPFIPSLLVDTQTAVRQHFTHICEL